MTVTTYGTIVGRWLCLATAVVVCTVHGPRATEAFRVLAVEHIAGTSHWNFMGAVLRALTDTGAGHRVTVFTPLLDGDRANYTEVDISDELAKKVVINADDVIDKFAGTKNTLFAAVHISRLNCKIIHDNRRMAEILDRSAGSEGFDVVIAELLMSECASYVAARLDVPLIYVIPSPMITYVERTVTGYSANPATVSHFLANHAVPGTFFQRFANLALTVHAAFIGYREETWQAIADPQPYDLVEPVKPSLVFTNSHFITESPRPKIPTVVEVGGIHLKPPKNIPREILEFIEDSTNGVIYFTLGSVVLMSTLPENVQNAFLEVLSQVPQRILWKYEGEMKNLPKNVMISKWFPQRDILLHPNIKLFMSHGGISGVYEAVDAGIPVLGFPLIYDQPRNIANLVDAGMAISMDLLNVHKDTLLKNVLEIINNEKYAKNAKIASEIFKDRPISPAQSVKYWTEYVVRHKGAPHLKSRAFNLTWYQYYLLDIIATILILISLTLFIFHKVSTVMYKIVVFKYLRRFKSKSV